MRLVAVRADADVSFGVHRAAAERAGRPTGCHDCRDLAAQFVATAEIDLHRDNFAGIVRVGILRADEDERFAAGVRAHRKLGGAEID